MAGRYRRLVVLGIAAVALAIGVFIVYGGSREPNLIEKLSAGDFDQKVEAIQGLEESDSDAAGRAIARASQDKDTRVARRAICALGRMKRPDLLDHIKTATRAKDESVRVAAITALGTAGDERDVSMLTENLSNTAETTRVRAASALSLGALDDFRAVPTLIEALSDPSPLVRGRAYAAIRKIYQLDVGFRAKDEPAKRQAAITRIQQLYPSLKERHADYMRRKKAREP